MELEGTRVLLATQVQDLGRVLILRYSLRHVRERYPGFKETKGSAASQRGRILRHACIHVCMHVLSTHAHTHTHTLSLSLAPSLFHPGSLAL